MDSRPPQTCVRCMHPVVGRQQDAYILHKSEKAYISQKGGREAEGPGRVSKGDSGTYDMEQIPCLEEDEEAGELDMKEAENFWDKVMEDERLPHLRKCTTCKIQRFPATSHCTIHFFLAM